MRVLVRMGLAVALGMPAVGAQAAAAQTAVQVKVDLQRTTGAYTPVFQWFGYDEANYTTAPNGRKLLRQLHDLSPVPVYIRAHHLFTSGDGVPELKWSSTNLYTLGPDGKPVYDFRIVDAIFDAYKQAGVRPMVELGFTPKDMVSDRGPQHEPYQVHYPKSTVSGSVNNPPKDNAAFGEMVRVFTAHLVERYGRDEVLGWYFEVWNEPDIDYWHGTPEEYARMYDYSVAGVRAALPGARVGGPASTGPGNAHAQSFLQGFLTHVRDGKSAATGGAVPLDFISFHVKGRPKIDNGRVTMGLQYELTDADRGFETVASFPQFAHLPIILSEADPEGCAACSSKVNPANNYRNGTLYPAYTAAAYKALLQLAQKRGVNLLGMLSWSFEFEGKDYFEGFRSLATNGVDKPILNFFRMAAMMRGTVAEVKSSGATSLEELTTSGVRGAADVDAFATSAKRSAEVLLWNYHDAEQTGAPAALELHVAGLPAKVRHVHVQQFRVDANHSNAYTVWLGMGSPQKPTAAQQTQLEKAGGLQSFGPDATAGVAGGVVTMRAELPRESVALYRLSW